MRHATDTTTAAHLIWARAASQGGFAYPYTSSLQSLSDLPFAAARLLGTPLAAATRDHLTGLIAQVPLSCKEIHLPYVDRQDLERVDQILTNTRLVEDAPTVFRVVREDQKLEQEFLRQCLILMAPAVFPFATAPATVTFKLDKIAPGGSFLPWVPNLAGSKGLEEPLPMRMTVSYTEQEERAWSKICPERHSDYVTRYGQMSVAMRRALRYWIPLIFLTKPENFQNAEWTWPLLGWASTVPQRARQARDFTYDVLDTDSMDRASKSMRRNLKPYLAGIHDSLNAIGEPLMAAHYSPERHAKGAAAAEYHRYNFNSLFAGEHYLVDILLNFGINLAALRKERLVGAPRMRAFHRLVKNFAKQICSRLRRFFGSASWEKLATVLLLELTNSLTGNRQPLTIYANGVAVGTAFNEDVELAA